MNYEKVILVGNATGDAELRASKKGDVKYATFSVGVGEDKDHPVYFPVVVFGRYGESLAGHIGKGRQVLVEGRITVGDNGRFNVVADQVRLGNRPEEKAGKSGE
jgi:single-stranded DNA-binding protein